MSAPSVSDRPTAHITMLLILILQILILILQVVILSEAKDLYAIWSTTATNPPA